MLDINLIWQIHVKYFFWLHRNIFEKIPWKSNIRYKNNTQEGHKITDWIQKDIVQYLIKVFNRNLIFKTWYTYKNISMHINKNFPSHEFNNFYNLLSSFSLCVILCVITVKKCQERFWEKMENWYPRIICGLLLWSILDECWQQQLRKQRFRQGSDSFKKHLLKLFGQLIAHYFPEERFRLWIFHCSWIWGNP